MSLARFLMTRRRLLIVSVLLLLPLIGVGVYWAMQPELKPGVTLENFRRLHIGMTKAQFVAILGEECVSSPTGQHLGVDYWLQTWQNERYTVGIIFVYDGNGTHETFATKGYLIEGKFVQRIDLAPVPEGVLAMLRRWVKEWTGW